MATSSTDVLVAALTDADDPRLAPVIERAKADYYHDFKSPLALPTMELVKDLRKAGQHDLARRAMDGEFDATKEESDAWAASPEGQATFRALLGM